MAAYYNENDLKTAAWLKELIRQGLIADGDVDERSIEDVQPGDLVGYRQCHFFAGIGGWSYALRLAGWADDREVWTGSCPCQPWSPAGKGAEADDSRDLWPAWFKLISKRLPIRVFGEQVAGKAGRAWLDRVYDDMEACEYAVAPIDLPAGSVGAPHIRQRLWFVADSARGGWGQRGEPGELADADGGQSCDGDIQRGRRHDEQSEDAPTRLLAHTNERRREEPDVHVRPARSSKAAVVERGAGYWSAADWVPCADGKWRPVEPGTFPLAHGLPARVGRLRGYGNAIVPQVAAEVIAAYMDICDEQPAPLSRL